MHEENAQPRAAVPQAGTQNLHVAQPPSAVLYAKPAKAAYRRNLPHIQAYRRPLFVTFRTRHGLLLSEEARSLVLKHCLHDDKQKITMHLVVVMPDHVHLLFTPKTDAQGHTFGLAEVLNGIKGASAHSVNRQMSRQGPVWQDESFDHVLRSDESLCDTIEYIRHNPVRKGLCQRPEEYPWLHIGSTDF